MDEAALLPRRQQARHRQLPDMERQRCGRQAELSPDLARGKPGRSVLDQQAEYAKPGFVRQGSQRAQRGRGFHISRIMET
jgi:hypothetical protein